MVHSLLWSGPVSRVLSSDILSLEWSSMIHEEDLSSRYGPCAVELGDHDSSFFRSIEEPHLNWEFEYCDSNAEDLIPSTSLPDWEFLRDSEAAEPQAYIRDVVVEEEDLYA